MRREAAQKSHFPLQWAHLLSSTQQLQALEPEPPGRLTGTSLSAEALETGGPCWKSLSEAPAGVGTALGGATQLPQPHLAVQGMIIPEQLADG